ncbi:hypothetical protein [Winogradskyella sp. SYSU M77433]|uniref:hypothetical protein n=1 Tax=Winogradskyella sp. SYSU M77433 TaxID=3042722 RepID=UPI00248081AE|nr:hypothetical protein [Winogradskyella sp. SYSU M77433]MDH7911120.1 hypothetical protein [Winogradskyella sp. SYSU M77433]
MVNLFQDKTKQRTKDILAIILIILVTAELLIYKSELNFAHSNIYKITFLNLIVIIGFTLLHSNKLSHRILSLILTIGIGFTILFFEFIGDYSGTEKKHSSWEIDNYEIIYATQEYFAGPGSEPYLKLRKKYLFGTFYEDIDETETEVLFLKSEPEDFIVKFIKTKTEFDLCKKKQLK